MSIEEMKVVFDSVLPAELKRQSVERPESICGALARRISSEPLGG